MVIEFPKCSFKCGECCQNTELAHSPDIEVTERQIILRYLNNPITSALCCLGLEPFDSYKELYSFVIHFRQYSNDPIIIYTGYYRSEIEDKIWALSKYKNIIVKFGRFIPNTPRRFESLLGVKLASNNQYAERIS